MAKQLLSLLGGALVVSEDAGAVSVSFDESLGGGAAAGVVQGKGTVVLNALQGLQLGEQLLNAHLPASMVPLAKVVEGVANQAAAALE